MKGILISESEKQRILEMHQNATLRQYLMEGVPNTTLASDGAITVVSRTVCATIDYIKVSFIVSNTGAADAYITQAPILSSDAAGILQRSIEYNVTIGGKPSWGQADGQNSPKVPKGKKATINCVIYTNLQYYKQLRDSELLKARSVRNPTEKARLEAEARKIYSDAMTKLTSLKTGTMVVRYNGPELQIPVNFGGFMIDGTKACDAAITLPKGF